jgi:uracil phosphoribosyltransferase
MALKPVTIITHPLVQAKLTRLRDQGTPMAEFRRLLGELAVLLVFEATRDVRLCPARVRTPLATARGHQLRDSLLLVPVLRAGLALVEPLARLIPEARVGFIGLRRNEQTLQPEAYLEKLPPNLSGHEVLLLDPMLATGGSAVAALEMLAARGARRIRLVNVLAAPEGIRKVHARFPRVAIYTAALDKGLDSRGYIVPGLGDAGDRAFGV